MKICRIIRPSCHRLGNDSWGLTMSHYLELLLEAHIPDTLLLLSRVTLYDLWPDLMTKDEESWSKQQSLETLLLKEWVEPYNSWWVITTHHLSYNHGCFQFYPRNSNPRNKWYYPLYPTFSMVLEMSNLVFHMISSIHFSHEHFP